MPAQDIIQKWTGELQLGSGWAHYRGLAGDTSPHSHYPLQALFCENCAADINIDGLEVHVRGSAVVPSNTPHQLKPTVGNVDILYVEPTLMSPDLFVLKKVGEWRDNLCCAVRQVSDNKIAEALAIIDSRLDSKIPLAALAKEVGMSKSSFTEKFKRATGLPLRRFVLWRRLYLAVRSVSEGISLTEAAHQAGFSDSAHFSRTMRETFGVSPSQGMLNIKMSVLPDGQCLRS